MTIETIREQVGAIRAVRDDDERAHSKEDELYEAFVRHVAAGPPSEVTMLAKEVLKTKKIEFSRWCA